MVSSPLKKFSHSRSPSKNSNSLPPSRQPSSGVARNHSAQATHSRNASQNQMLSGSQLKSRVTSMDLARLYEADRARIVKYCFSKRELDGQLHESYITHVRIIEDSHSPSLRPPSDSDASHKKSRILVISVRKTGRVRLHKARENPDGSVQIGRTWDLDELTKLEKDLMVPTGFILVLGKQYYWETASPKETTVFNTSVINTYMKYTGKLPELVNWDLNALNITVPPNVSRNASRGTDSPDTIPENGPSAPSPLRPIAPRLQPQRLVTGDSVSESPQRVASADSFNFSSQPLSIPKLRPEISQVPDLSMNKHSLETELPQQWQNPKPGSNRKQFLQHPNEFGSTNSGLERPPQQQRSQQKSPYDQGMNNSRQNSLTSTKMMQQQQQQQYNQAPQQQFSVPHPRQGSLGSTGPSMIKYPQGNMGGAAPPLNKYPNEMSSHQPRNEPKRNLQIVPPNTSNFGPQQTAVLGNSPNTIPDSRIGRQPYQQSASPITPREIHSAGYNNARADSHKTPVSNRSDRDMGFNSNGHDKDVSLYQKYLGASRNSPMKDDYSDSPVENLSSNRHSPLKGLNNIEPHRDVIEIDDDDDDDEEEGDGNDNDSYDVAGYYAGLDEEEEEDDSDIQILGALEVPRRKDLSELETLKVPERRDIYDEKIETEDGRKRSHSVGTPHAIDPRVAMYLSEEKPSSNKSTELTEFVDEIFEKIDWSSSDDVSTMEKKLMRRLVVASNESCQLLINIGNDQADLKRSIDSSLNNCKVLDPLMAFFNVEILSFKDEINQINNKADAVGLMNRKALYREIASMR